jgi:hypothetical protein
MPGKNETIDFTVDQTSLYREESFTDMQVAAVRRLVPVFPNGKEDTGRTPIFIGSTQLMSPQGPLPLQAKLQANNLIEAWDAFPEAIKKAMAEMVKELEKINAEQKQEEESRIIVPGS